MGTKGSYYGGIVLDGLVFHIDAAKQESYAKTGMRYMQNGNNELFVDFADTYVNPSYNNSTGTIINGATFSNFAPYHLSDYSTPYWHNSTSNAWKDSAGTGTFYGNIEFDGVDDYVSFSATPDMNTTDITVSSWFYVNNFKSGAVPTGDTLSMVVSRYNSISANNGWELFYDNKGVVHFGGREDNSLYIYATASFLLQAATKAPGLTANGGWYNVVGTKSGNTWRLYIAESNKYIKYNNNSQDTRIYTYPYKQALSGSVTAGTGTIPFAQNNLLLGKPSYNQLYMDGRIMSVSIYNRALSLTEINKNYDSFSKRIIKPEFDRGLNNPNVLITYNVVNTAITQALSNISARETALGKTVTVIAGYANLPSNLSTYSHIWDIDYNTDQLVTLNSSKYTTYLQGGGALFLIGENSGFPQRNNALATFITSVGGGTISFDGAFPVVNTECIMDNQFLLENSNNSVTFPAIGRFSSIGTGTNIVFTNVIYNSYPVGTQGLAVVWKTGSLSNAPKGAIVSVLDVNIWQTTYANTPYNGSDFIKNVSLILDRF